MSRPLHHFTHIARGTRSEVSDIGLHASQDIDVLWGGKVAGLALRDELSGLLGAGCAAFAGCLQGVDFLKQADIDIEEESGALLLNAPPVRVAGIRWGGWFGGSRGWVGGGGAHGRGGRYGWGGHGLCDMRILLSPRQLVGEDRTCIGRVVLWW